MNANRVVVWFRQDLRINDNEALTNAVQQGKEIIPVFVFDERTFFGKTAYGFHKTGKFRTKFIIESVEELRQSFQKLGIDLVVRIGKPEIEIAQIVEKTQASAIFCNIERTQEEVEVQDALEKKLWKTGKEIIYSRGKMLYYTQDLPFPICQTPDIFTHFRKEVEKYIPVRKPLPAPTMLEPWSFKINVGEMPTLKNFGFDDFELDKRSTLMFKGGETAARERLHYYLWESDLIKKYKDTRDGLIGADYSSKLSVWLAQGCISPKQVYYELKEYEKKRKKNQSTYWLFFELLWRDFFRLMGKKHKNKIFQKGGTRGEIDPVWKDDMQLFKIWSEGKTGVPFIDANMRELNLTGFMSNRGRQNVASFLVHDMKINWQMGAEYFESLLIDYDPCSNWGNWNYLAGVGCDPRENRYFNILTQAKRYDPQGDYVKLWLPELVEVPIAKVHQVDILSKDEQQKARLVIGSDYPMSIVNTQKWS
jgi:deoxyribodipyrimidine photo-lyase